LWKKNVASSETRYNFVVVLPNSFQQMEGTEKLDIENRATLFFAFEPLCSVSVNSRTQRRATASRIEPSFATFQLLAWRQLTAAATCYYQSNHSKVG